MNSRKVCKAVPSAKKLSPVQTDKENLGAAGIKREESKSKEIKAVLRHPLSNLNENVFSRKNLVKTRKDVIKSTTTSRFVPAIDPQRRSKSTGTAEGLQKIKLPENITNRESKDEDTDDVFVDGKDHCITFSPNENKQLVVKKSEVFKSEEAIKHTLPVVRTSERRQDSEGAVKKPAQKTTLIRKLSNRSSRNVRENIFTNCMYEEYIQDNYKYMLDTEEWFVLRRSCLEKRVDSKQRMAVVNWMVYAQQVLNLQEATLFAAVWTFDKVLISTKVPPGLSVLFAVCCLWVNHKLQNSQLVQASTICSLCGEKYTRQQILSTEKEILTLINFRLNPVEPNAFLYYYLHHEHLENDTKILNASLFLLECFMLLLEFSSTHPSLLASSALCLALTKFDIDHEQFLKFLDSHLLDMQTFKKFTAHMSKMVKSILQYKSVCNEIITKYSTSEKLKVAEQFID